jgi:hypothetical protein
VGVDHTARAECGVVADPDTLITVDKGLRSDIRMIADDQVCRTIRQDETAHNRVAPDDDVTVATDECQRTDFAFVADSDVMRGDSGKPADTHISTNTRTEQDAHQPGLERRRREQDQRNKQHGHRQIRTIRRRRRFGRLRTDAGGSPADVGEIDARCEQALIPIPPVGGNRCWRCHPEISACAQVFPQMPDSRRPSRKEGFIKHIVMDVNQQQPALRSGLISESAQHFIG